MKSENKGYILGVVLCTAVLVMMIVGSVFELLNTQRKLSLKKELMLQATNTAETALDYAYSCVINDINTSTIRLASSLPATGHKNFTFTPSVENYLTANPTMHPGYSGRIGNITYSNLLVSVLPATSPAQRYFVNGNDQANATSPVKNQWVYQQMVPIVARATATQSGQSYTAYVQKSVASQEVDLFQYAIFFQGQLHMHRGFRPMGDVHTNGMLFLNAQDGDAAIYNGAVSATGHIYRGSTFDVGGTGSDGYAYVPINSQGDADFTSTNPIVSPYATGTSNQLKILVQGSTNYVQYSGPTPRPYKHEGEDIHTDPSGWAPTSSTGWACVNFNGNLLDKSHLVPPITLVGAAGYAQDYNYDPAQNPPSPKKGEPYTNEFNNGPYKLIEPTFPEDSAYDNVRMMDPTTGYTYNSNNLEANASLILIIEYNCDDTDSVTLHRIADGENVIVGGAVGQGGRIVSMSAPDPTASPDVKGQRPTLSKYSDPWRMFVLKGYRVKSGWDPTNVTMKDVHKYLHAITLPKYVFGGANTSGNVAPVNIDPTRDLKMEDFDVALSGPINVTSTIVQPLVRLSTANINTLNTDTGMRVKISKGLFDSRLGRGVAPLTIDIDALRDVLGAPSPNFAAALAAAHNLVQDTAAQQFRSDFDPTEASTTYKPWNGLIYIEFPTSLTVDSASSVNTNNGISTLRFAYSSTPEYMHPDRAAPTDSRTNRHDNIVPFAQELRRYPPAATAKLNSTILDAQYAIPAVQLINARFLPNPNAASNPLEGFTIATNAPVYIVGNYNSDGNFNTGSNIANDSPGSYAQADAGEISAAIFCDTFTVLSNGWGLRDGTSGLSNRNNSFYGTNNGSTNGDGTTVGNIGNPPGRPAKSLTSAQRPQPYHYATNSLYNYPDSNPTAGTSARPYVEIGACIATGEYPIFEFFTHALESYQTMYNTMSTTKANAIIFKGSMVGMFHSEIQHIKQAYGRSISSNVQTSGDPSGDIWQQHGAYAIAGSRYSQFLVNGNFPPGTPKAYYTSQKDFTLLHWNDPSDAAVLTNAGFTAP